MPLARASQPPRQTTAARTGRIHVLDIPYDMMGVAHANDAVWDKAAKVFSYVGDTLPAALHGYRAMPYSWEAYQEAILNGEEADEAPPQREIVLRPHQKEAVEALRRARDANHPGFLIADEVGLGKTIEAWQAALEMDDETVLIVGPLSSLANWRRTVQWMGDGGKTVLIINYDRLKKVFEIPDNIVKAKRRGRKRAKVRKVRTQKGIARFGKVLDFDLVIWDESHRRRIATSARSSLGAGVDKEAEFVIWLSATAGQDPVEISYLAPILASSSGTRVRDLGEYADWCGSQGIGVVKAAFGKMAWAGRAPADADEATKAAAAEAHARDLPLINRLLYGGAVPVGIRRRPEDIVGWPAMQREIMPMPLLGQDRYAYEQAWKEFRETLGLSQGHNSKSGLVAQLRFRQKASLLRTASTVDLALEFIEKGHSVAISTQFLEPLDVMRAALEGNGVTVVEYSGRVHETVKEQNRLRFQRDQAQVMLYTVTESVNLHQGEEPEGLRPRSNVIHDVRWSAIDVHQIAGRTHRDGRFSRSYWLVAEDTVEEAVANVVAGRIRSMGAMQGDEAMVAEIERVLAGLDR